MLLLILVLLVSIPLVSPSYHIPKLGRYHTFLRIGKRDFAEPCHDPMSCLTEQQRLALKCIKYLNRDICWPELNQRKAVKEQYSKQNRFNNRFNRDNT